MEPRVLDLEPVAARLSRDLIGILLGYSDLSKHRLEIDGSRLKELLTIPVHKSRP